MSQSVQRKQGVGGMFRPVSWNKGRRFTSPGPEIQKVNGSTPYEGPLMRLQIEAYLDDNPEFTESYVLRKVTRRTVEKWLNIHSGAESENQSNPLVIVQSSENTPRKYSDDYLGKYQTGSSYTNRIKSHFSGENTPNLKKRSLSVTPSRKISASTFEASGLRSPIITTGDDGSPSFLTASTTTLDLSRQRSRSAVLNGDQRSLGEVTCSLASDMDLSSVSQKIARHILHFSKREWCSIALPRTGDVNGFSIVVNNIRRDEVCEKLENKTFHLENNVVSKLNGGRSVEVAGIPGVVGEAATLLPLRDLTCQLQGVALLASSPPNSLEIAANTALADIARVSGICLRNATEHHSAILEVTRSQVFLDLARVIFDHQSSVEFTVLKILLNFLMLIECERAQVMLSHKGKPTKFYKVFDLEDKDLLSENFSELSAPYENRFPINLAITGLVAATGETVNIGDLLSDSRFDLDINCDANLKHRSLLCMPIMDSERDILGVVSLINKRSGRFSENDERFVEAFGVFCGIALRNVSQYEAARQAEARSQVALEIMSYHAASDPQEAEELAQLGVPSALSYHLMSLSFSDSNLSEMDTVRACLRMFYDLDLVTRFSLDHLTLCRWLLTVRKNYRAEVLYHNWDHAFNVAQMMFSCLINSSWWSHLGPISCLGLMVACLSHDLDHRGTNNSYQLATDSPLARLYSTSTLERHHLNQALIILNLDGNRILENLSAVEYSATMDVLEEAIIATDLALHFAHLPRLKALAAAGPEAIDWTCPTSLATVRAALMTGADLGGSTKPWEVQKEVAGLIAEEFWQQGDMERRVLDKPSNTLMDREQSKNFPVLQVGFCRGVCLPVYECLATLCPALQPLQEGVISNANRWQDMADRNKLHDNSGESDEEEEGEEVEAEAEDEEEEEEEEAVVRERIAEASKVVRNL